MKSLRMTDGEYTAHQKRVAGQAGGCARAAALSPESRKEIAKKGATARWAGHTRATPKPDYARQLAKQIKATGLPEPLLEFTFDAQLDGSGRSWRFDLCWPKWLAIEVDGAVHRIRERFEGDLPKHQAPFKLGYKLLRVSPEQVRNGEALELVRRALT